MTKYTSLPLLLLAALLFHGRLLAQNLVPNPGFEIRTACPSALGDILFATGWGSPTPIQNGSPDYYNQCATSVVRIPETDWGYEYARSGQAYAGLIVWEGNQSGHDAREYLQCQLNQPLQAGKDYCVTFYVSPTISKVFSNINFSAIDEIGVNFSPGKYYQSTGYTINLPYHVKSTPGQFLNDTLNWMKVTGIYKATGGEQWMILGCFKTNGTAPAYNVMHPASPNPTYMNKAYMFIDDVSVVLIDPKDTTIITHDSTVCDPNNFTMKLNSTGNEDSYLWSTGATKKEITVNKTGTYWCRSTTYCQTFVDTFHVIYDPSVKLRLGKDTGNCLNLPMTITYTGNFTGLVWSTGQQGPTVNITQSGTYILTGSNECGTQSDTINVFIETAPPPPIVSDTAICQWVNDPKLAAKGSNLKWYSNENSLYGSEYPPYISTKVPAEDIVWVTQTVGHCESDKVPIRITIKFTPRNVIEQNEVTMCEKSPELIGVQLPYDVQYRWSTGPAVCCIRPDHDGIYRLATYNDCGSYVDTIKVNFSACDTCVTISNAFTPNYDGRNDRFKPIIMCPVDEFSMQVFNRWGNKIFSTTNPNDAWDGSYNGERCDLGIYVYVIRYRSSATRREKALQGNVMLLR